LELLEVGRTLPTGVCIVQLMAEGVNMVMLAMV